MMRLRELRKELNLTQKEFGEKLGLTAHNIGDWERGKGEPSIDWLVKIADVYNISADYLLGREDDFGVKIYENSGQLSDRIESDDIEREAIAILRRYPPEYKKHALVALENDLDTIIEVKKGCDENKKCFFRQVYIPSK